MDAKRKMNHPIEQNLYQSIANLVHQARQRVLQAINLTMVQTYYEIGRMIVEDEQQGKERAEYGKNLLISLSQRLIHDFGKGFSKDNLENMRKFYLAYSKAETVSRLSGNNPDFKLSWSHYVFLMRLNNISERQFYEIEAHQNNWSLRELKRQFDTGLFERLLLSKNKDKVQLLAKKGQLIQKPEDAVKDPYILEFLGFDEKTEYSESELEQKIIDKLEHFLLELGKGYTFVARQKRITLDESHFYIDLVFYNRLLKAFVLVDLKIGSLKHQDLGQMMMYVNYYDRFEKTEDENKTIGIILCRDKNNALVEVTLPEENRQIFASQYQTVLPSKEEFKHILQE